MRILMVQPSLEPLCGGNGVAAWMVQTLARRGRVTVLTCVPLDLTRVDAAYGTDLRSARLENRLIPAGISRLLKGVRLSHELLKLHLLMREARRITNGYDVICSANNEIDVGRPGALASITLVPCWSSPRRSVSPIAKDIVIPRGTGV